MSEELEIKIHSMDLPRKDLVFIISLIEKHLNNGGTEDDFFIAGVIQFAERTERKNKIIKIINNCDDIL